MIKRLAIVWLVLLTSGLTQVMKVSSIAPTGLDVTLYSGTSGYTLFPGNPSIWAHLRQNGYVEYTLESDGGNYGLQVYYADGSGTSGIATVSVNGAVQPSIPVTPTGGWSSYKLSASSDLALPAGRSTFRIAAAMPFHAMNLAGIVLTPNGPSPSRALSLNLNLNPLAGDRFYVNPYSVAAKNIGQACSAAPIAKIAQQPQSVWFGDWNYDPQGDVATVMRAAAAQGTVPIITAYNMVHRDCGGYSSGGAANADAYKWWIRSLSLGIGNGKAVVILEPDAVTQYNTQGCLNDSQKDERLSLLQYAASMFNQNSPNASVYLDGGPPNGIDPGTMARTLNYAGLQKVTGFAVNVANYETTTSSILYGQQISNQTGGKHFVIDTSRNGLGPTPDHQYCNPVGRGLGSPSQGFSEGSVDGYLWVQNPGTSDGYCNGAPAAGQFSGTIACTLLTNSIF